MARTRPPKPPAAVSTAAAEPSFRKLPPLPLGGIGIRMYRLGVGDCFLVRLPRPGGGEFRLLVDCGIHAAQEDGKGRIRRAVGDLLGATNGQLDVVIGTHEHWDHLSGFLHADDLFQRFSPCAIWCAWTENMKDSDAAALQSARAKGVTALWGAAARLKLADAFGAQPSTGEAPREWDGLLGFFGESAGVGVKAKAAAEAMHRLAASDAVIAYRSPGEAPFDAVSEDWRIFVLGPPRDRALIERSDPRKGSGEVYGFAAAASDTAMAAGNLTAAVSLEDDPPFDSRHALPLELTKQPGLVDDPAWRFFQDRYWAATAPGPADPDEETGQAWRQMGYSWLDGAEPLALKLDKDTNNTSLVLAIELGPKGRADNPVVLFAADAQVGNWESWQQVEWPDYAGRKVTGPDLLQRTVIYKVGHHASHNATLKQGGLETMQRLRLALVPTDAVMAAKVQWGTLPWPALLTRLGEMTGDRLLRSDLGASDGTAPDRLPPGLAVTANDDMSFDIAFTPDPAPAPPAPPARRRPRGGG